mmetsp:Transcript_19512/g.31032  ORF Transcript_19512/g.31032 Transcript_19512/m.31032 type:complete len:299 (-) Transcript_19512:222-1118(-)
MLSARQFAIIVLFGWLAAAQRVIHRIHFDVVRHVKRHHGRHKRQRRKIQHPANTEWAERRVSHCSVQRGDEGLLDGVVIDERGRSLLDILDEHVHGDDVERAKDDGDELKDLAIGQPRFQRAGSQRANHDSYAFRQFDIHIERGTLIGVVGQLWSQRLEWHIHQSVACIKEQIGATEPPCGGLRVIAWRRHQNKKCHCIEWAKHHEWYSSTPASVGEVVRDVSHHWIGQHIKGSREYLEECNECSRDTHVVQIVLDDEDVDEQGQWNESKLRRSKHEFDVPEDTSFLIDLCVCLSPIG